MERCTTNTFCGVEDFPTDKYLEGQGDVVSRLISTITHIITPIIPTIDLLIKFP